MTTTGVKINKQSPDSVTSISIILPNRGSSSQEVHITTLPLAYFVPHISAFGTLRYNCNINYCGTSKKRTLKDSLRSALFSPCREVLVFLEVIGCPEVPSSEVDPLSEVPLSDQRFFYERFLYERFSISGSFVRGSFERFL